MLRDRRCLDTVVSDAYTNCVRQKMNDPRINVRLFLAPLEHKVRVSLRGHDPPGG